MLGVFGFGVQVFKRRLGFRVWGAVVLQLVGFGSGCRWVLQFRVEVLGCRAQG